MSAYLILIDDDPVQQKIAELYVNRYKAFRKYTSFIKAKPALEYLYSSRNETELLPDIILLDLDMPGFSGWDFLEGFEQFSQEIKKKIQIYILSSSIDSRDQDRARKFESVKGFYTKPISRLVIEDISGKVLSPP